MKRTWALALVAFSLVCTVVMAVHAWGSGAVGDAGTAGFAQFVLLLVATPLLMTVAGVAYVVDRYARLSVAGAQPSRAFMGLILAFVAMLAVNWLLLYRLAATL
jgi:hypothetical protein